MKVIFTLVIILSIVTGENILFFFQQNTISHRNAVWPLVEALANRGHNITFHYPDPISTNHRNIRIFSPTSFRKSIESLQGSDNFFNLRLKRNSFERQLNIMNIMKMSVTRCKLFLEDVETVEWFKNANFDLVIIDNILSECGLSLGYKFNAKTIGFTTFHPLGNLHEPFGIIQDTSVLPVVLDCYQIPMTFFQRVYSTLIVLLYHYARIWFVHHPLDEVVKSKFNDSNMPSFRDLEANLSLILYNSHFSEDEARALPPMFVPIGGIHCDWDGTNVKKPIEKNIEKFIEETVNGFIYISFGSEAKLQEAPSEFLTEFFTALARSQTQFLLKWEGPRLREISSNVYTTEWMPQQRILASRNCRGFITHGGLLSVQESIFYGVPMIAVPIFADQDYNAFRIERTGRGIKLEAAALKSVVLVRAIYQLLNNKTYKENVEKIRILFKDRPQSPIETGVYWTEYILRHNDTSNLKPIHAISEYWFQRRLLDVWTFIFGIILIVSYTTWILFKQIIKYISNFILKTKNIKFKNN